MDSYILKAQKGLLGRETQLHFTRPDTSGAIPLTDILAKAARKRAEQAARDSAQQEKEVTPSLPEAIPDDSSEPKPADSNGSDPEGTADDGDDSDGTADDGDNPEGTVDDGDNPEGTADDGDDPEGTADDSDPDESLVQPQDGDGQGNEDSTGGRATSPVSTVSSVLSDAADNIEEP